MSRQMATQGAAQLALKATPQGRTIGLALRIIRIVLPILLVLAIGMIVGGAIMKSRGVDKKEKTEGKEGQALIGGGVTLVIIGSILLVIVTIVFLLDRFVVRRITG